MDTQEFAELLAFGREQRGVEFKQGGSRKDKHLLAKVVRAMIGMANRRDGGKVVVGVADHGDQNLQPNGVDPEDLKTWKYDHLADSIAAFADPNVQFDLEIVKYNSGEFLVVTVHEFADLPVLCKRQHSDVLREGACYVRPRRKPETVEVSTQADMRDLLDLAIEKGVRRFITQARAAGLGLSGPFPPTDADQFNAQAREFLGVG